MIKLLEKAENYIYENSSNLQKACIEYIGGRGDKHKIEKELSIFQNSDGGWANGLEIEYPGAVSSPFTTAAALGYISRFDLIESDLFHDTLKYLKNTQHENGKWDDSKEILKYPHPPYMGSGIYLEYKTGMILKWLLRLNVSDKEMMDRALAYLIEIFDEVSVKNDFWSAVAYSGVFSLLPNLQESQKIMKWSMQILIPQKEQFGWQQVMGIIEDDMPIPEQAHDISIHLIKENQEEDGGWPHQFGTYNRVWSAIYMLRFLKSKNLIYQG